MEVKTFDGFRAVVRLSDVESLKITYNSTNVTYSVVVTTRSGDSFIASNCGSLPEADEALYSMAQEIFKA